jgi:lauroyl/myristoyl acyltransferase
MSGMAISAVDNSILLLGKFAYVLFYLFGWQFMNALGGLIGDSMYLLDRQKREITKAELTTLLGSRLKESIEDVTRKSFQNYYKRLTEMIFFGALTKRRVERIIRAEGLENLDRALSKGKGAILLLSHFGSFLLPLPFLGFKGYKVNQITGKQIHSSLLAERGWVWRKKEADKLPIMFLQANTFFRPVYKALNNNEILVIAFDGRDSSRWVTTDFLQRKARFSPGPFELARRTGAEILPTFTIREKRGFHKLILKPRTFSELFASYIARYPCHFGMVLYKLRQMKEAGMGAPFFLEN